MRNKKIKGQNVDGFSARLLAGDSTTFDIGSVLTNTFRQDSYTISETFAIGSNLVSSSTLGVFAAYTHSFADLPSASAWSGIFDRYRFKQVSVEFVPLATQENTSTSNQLGFLHTSVDFDDATAPALTATIERYSTYAGIVGNKPLRRVYVPRISNTIYYNGIVNAYAEGLPNTWVDMANQSVPHYGLKAGLDPTTVAGNVAYVVRATYVIQVAGRR